MKKTVLILLLITNSVQLIHSATICACEVSTSETTMNTYEFSVLDGHKCCSGTLTGSATQTSWAQNESNTWQSLSSSSIQSSEAQDACCPIL